VLREEKLFRNISLTEGSTWLASINAWTADRHNLSAAMDMVQNKMVFWMTNRLVPLACSIITFQTDCGSDPCSILAMEAC